MFRFSCSSIFFLTYDGYLGRITANIGERDWPWIAHIHPTIAFTICKTLLSEHNGGLFPFPHWKTNILSYLSLS